LEYITEEPHWLCGSSVFEKIGAHNQVSKKCPEPTALYGLFSDSTGYNSPKMPLFLQIGERIPPLPQVGADFLTVYFNHLPNNTRLFFLFEHF
jgi:hypothetical protein